MCFSANRTISQEDFDALVAKNVAEAARKKAENDARKEKINSEGAQRIREFCAKYRISFDFLMECHDIVNMTSTDALKRIATEVNSDYFTRGSEMFIKDDYTGAGRPEVNSGWNNMFPHITAQPKVFDRTVDEKELIGATVVSVDTQRFGVYQSQIILQKGEKKYLVCTSTNGKVQITEVKDA